MHIIGISGSLRVNSTNTKLLRAIASLAPPDSRCTIYEGLDTLPHFSPERDTDLPPSAVADLRSLILTADIVLICTPEYAFGVPGSLKNALDWTVSSGSLNQKCVGVISASPLFSGGAHAHAALLLTLSALGAVVPERAKLMIPGVTNKLDTDGLVIDQSLIQSLQEVISALIQSAALPE